MHNSMFRWLVVIPVIGILAGMILPVPQYPIRDEGDYELVLNEEQ